MAKTVYRAECLSRRWPGNWEEGQDQCHRSDKKEVKQKAKHAPIEFCQKWLNGQKDGRGQNLSGSWPSYGCIATSLQSSPRPL